MKDENAGEWMPHFGGACPVKPGTLIDVRYRAYGEAAGMALNPADNLEESFWENTGNGFDIVAWRYHNIEKQASNDLLTQLKTARTERDRAEAAYQEALEAVRSELGDGFTLDDSYSVRDLPPKKWRAGDVVECVKDDWFTCEKFSIGGSYKVKREIDKEGCILATDDQNLDMEAPTDHFRFRHRPNK